MFRFWIINSGYAAVVKFFAYLEDIKMDKFFALKRSQPELWQSHIMFVWVVTYLSQLNFFKPTAKLTRINWGNNRNRAANPLQNPGKVLTHLLINLSTLEWLGLVKNIFKPDSILITLPGLLFWLEQKHLYTKCSDDAEGDQQHLGENQNSKVKFAFTALCLWL